MPCRLVLWIGLMVGILAPFSGVHGGVTAESVLPPLPSWDGASRSLVVPVSDPWITPAEASEFRDSPDYAETISWLERLVAASPRLAWTSLGTSPEGREIRMVIASKQGAATPQALASSGRPTLLAQAGIHSGEIDGKDAGMMLLRDMTVRGTKSDLLEAANLLFVPIFNVDGHERSGPYGRMNQRGPSRMGWRTTSRNLNLNRDYSKLDTPEMRAMIAAILRYRPDLYLDIHVTDGSDYQYDVTLGWTGPHAHSPSVGRWLDERFGPAARRDLKAMGHLPGPLIFFVDRHDPGKGIRGWTPGPRFSNGYGDARHLPTVLVENHSLKPFGRRVLGTYVLLESSMRILAAEAGALRRAVEEDRGRRSDEVPLSWKEAEGEPENIELLGVESRHERSSISGRLWTTWTGRPVKLEVPHRVATEPAVTVDRPDAYFIPPAWDEVIERLELHGLKMQRIDQPLTLDVDVYRIKNPEYAKQPYEGHMRVTAEFALEPRRQTFPPGTVRIPTDQPLGRLAALLLEPQSPDSFFQWGFFLEVLQRTEYFESYVMEPLAERMLADSAALREEFEEKLATDGDFLANPRARLDWFYERTPYFDERYSIYPVARQRMPRARSGGPISR